MGKKKQRAAPAQPPEAAPFNAGLAGLGALDLKLAPSAQPHEDTAAEAPTTEGARLHEGEPSAEDTGLLAGKLIVRHERKGHGGKTVTLLQGVDGSEEDRRELARELARTLGCRAQLQGKHIVLSGDLRERLSKWLAQRGARRVVHGSG